MIITKEVTLSNFEAWSGAVDTINALTLDERQQLELCLEDMYPEGMDETELNDMLWFNTDFIAECLGYTDWEALERAHREEEEEEEE